MSARAWAYLLSVRLMSARAWANPLSVRLCQFGLGLTFCRSGYVSSGLGLPSVGQVNVSSGLGLRSEAQVNVSLCCNRNVNITPKTMFRRADLMPNFACTRGSLICLLSRSAPSSSSSPNTSPDVSTPWNTSSSQDQVRPSLLEISCKSIQCLFVSLFWTQQPHRGQEPPCWRGF